MTQIGETVIVELQRGNVVIGVVAETGHEVTLRPSAVIRRWGTTRGLGQLAAYGPTPDTVLDPCDEVRYHVLTDILTIPCRSNQWSGKIGVP